MRIFTGLQSWHSLPRLFGSTPLFLLVVALIGGPELSVQARSAMDGNRGSGHQFELRPDRPRFAGA